MRGTFRELAAKTRVPQAFGLERDRLLHAGERSVLLVLAPAGHGKTTLLTHLAVRFPGPVAWYRVDSDDRDPAVLSAGLARAVATAVGLADPPADLGALAETLAGGVPGDALDGSRRPGLLVVDDLHEIAGSAAEDELVRLVGRASDGLGVALAARRVPGVDVAALRITRAAELLDTDDLRFRSWEVERLFREVYGEPLPPEDAAALSRRTEGWAAGLAMFHLATHGQPPARRRQALDELVRGSRLVRGYLVREVLGELPADLREFLRRTSSLGVLTGALCDALLGTADSASTLAVLERRRLFIHVDRSGERYRYHQVLADHLELELTDALGPLETRRWYRRTAEVLLNAGEARAAFRALARAEDWAAVEGLLRERGEQVVAGPVPAADGLPADLIPAELHRHDPWLRLAEARRLRGHGAVREAVEAYREAADLAEAPDLVAVCRAESRAVAVWLPDGGQPPVGPFGLLRAATRQAPAQRLIDLGGRSDPDTVLSAGVVAALCGDDERAEQLLRTAGEHPRADAATVWRATCARAGLCYLRGVGPLPVDELETTVQDAEQPEPWLARLARALLAAGRSETVTLPLLRIGAEADGDRWGVALVSLVQALAGRHPQDHRDAADALAEVGAPVVALWARSLAAAADPGSEPAADLARHARRLGVRDVPAIAARWRSADRPGAAADGGPAPVGPGRAGAAPSNGASARGTAGPAARTGPVVRVGVLGGFRLTVREVPVDLSAVRPRSRATLHLLALHARRWVHRDVIAAAMWPEAAPEAALRSLQVAISSLRTAIAAMCPGVQLPARQGESYGLVVPEGLDSDVLEFEAALSAARHARARGDAAAEHRELARALDGYGGDLLPEDGPAEWVVGERDRLRLAAADAAHALALAELAAGDGAAAVDDVRRCLHLDPYRDAAWHLLVRLHQENGDEAAARAAQAQRQKVLEDLGIPAALPS